jgi:hypothetical protein
MLKATFEDLGNGLAVGSFLDEKGELLVRTLPIVSLLVQSCPNEPQPGYMVLPNLQTFYLLFNLLKRKPPMLLTGVLHANLLWAIWTQNGCATDIVISSSYEFVRDCLEEKYIPVSRSLIPFPEQVDPCDLFFEYKGDTNLGAMFKQGKNVLHHIVSNTHVEQGSRVIPFVFVSGVEKVLTPSVTFDNEHKSLSCKVESILYTQYYNFATCKLKRKTRLVIDDLD